MNDPLITQNTQKSEAINLQHLLKQVGDKNKYQLIILIIFIFQWMVSVSVLFGPLFFLNEPKFLCQDGKICENEKLACEENAPLLQDQKITMSISFNLYCDRSILRTISSSITFFGSIVGNLLFSFMAERLGRRFMMIFSWGFCTVGVIGINLSINFTMLAIFQFISGCGIIPSNSLNLVILGEQYGNKSRQKATTALLMSCFIISPQKGNSVYANATIVAVGEFLAYLLSNQLITYLPRKQFTIICMALSNLLCLLSFVFADIELAMTINSALIRIFNCLTFSILHVYIQELYPTPVRSMGVGLQMGIGLIGSFLAPYILSLFKYLNMSQLGGVGLIFIPFNFANILYQETKDQILEDVLEEEKQYLYENQNQNMQTIVQDQDQDENERNSNIL
ncbi:Major facilitator superfamily domain, general substrate transporter [Pseudocohnilembus persalinus]|uniref:Major facilitator superfamily domain, general substrate transporter n=1 Tax=Pseudocohnilembus persalinus TaxID=266149 RepID=A0A0V0QU18_PSEPJ|nr:Major facilitator superfamily domain, general substrate transporter [Pseudocohnilembus persalinus]|eukprot:KRX05820.1 Major facilitator superfamily domain, general substrate transporter [Pseudocohnilembus persalinus]